MDTEQPSTFAALLRHYRRTAGLTQEELAERARLSRAAIDTLERGTRRRPRKDTVALLAGALGLPDEERAAFVAAARRTPAAALAATPPERVSAANGGHATASDAADLPHGIVTFLFADVEGSTRLLHQLGSEQYAEVLAQVQSLLRSVWATHAGHELGTQGDRFFAVFAYADDALAAASAAQQALTAQHWPDGAQVRMRMGLHTGPALLKAGRYIGLEVHRAARIAAAGHGGQVVVSGALADQVAKFGYVLPDDTRLRSLGTHRLQDLPHREQLYELELPALPGLPAAFPPLRTLDAWPGLRADLTAVVCMSALLLAVVGLMLALLVPAFPWAIGLGAAVLAVLILLSAALAQPVRRALQTQWRDARKPVSAVTSTLLSLVVVVTTLFITKQPIILGPQHVGYDFTYTPHPPTRTGGSVVIETWSPIHTLIPPYLNGGLPDLVYHSLWNGCVVQLPDVELGLKGKGWQPDQCTRVPTVDNDDESQDGRTTIFHIDPRAMWSDGVPLTAADFLFAWRLATDPKVNGAAVWLYGSPSPPFTLMHLTAPDPYTVHIAWSEPYGDYLAALAQFTPLPLHVYARGAFAGVYDPVTDTYTSALAQRMAAEDSFNLHIPVDNGPFTVEPAGVEGYPFPEYRANQVSSAQRLVLARNPRFFSKFFHYPSALDRVTFVTTWTPDLLGHPELALARTNARITLYRQGGLTLADGFRLAVQSHLGGIPTGEVVNSPAPDITALGFNQRDEAPNARANGGVSIFSDIRVRTALTQAFDRCAALRAELGVRNCADPTFHTDELTALPAADYDPTFALPAYDPTAAQALLQSAGFPVVGGVRRYKDGTTPLVLTLSLSSSGALYEGMARRLQQDYESNLHIAVQIENPPGQLFGSALPPVKTPAVTGAFDIAMFGWAGSADPVGILAGLGWDSASIPSVQNPSGSNILGTIDPWVLARDQLGTREVDDAQRAEIYLDLARHVAQQFDYLPLLVDADTVLVKPTLCNFKQWPADGAYLWNLADWYLASSCP
jgi:ABC-type transport system substrate-binding protein/class 3 adenylate cyclase